MVDRGALLDRLDVAIARPLTWISGPLGSGKTTLVRTWCEQRAGDRPVRWTDDVPLDVEPGAVVVLDDVDDAKTARAVADLAVRHRDADVHLVAASRRPFAAELAAARVALRFDHLQERDLRLDAAELAALVHEHTEQRVDDALAQELVDAVEGWLAAALLVALDWDRAANARTFRSVLARPLGAAAALAADATLDGLDDDAVELLLRTAGVPELAPGLCDELLGATAAANLLAAIRTNGGLVGASRFGPELQRLHPLLRQGLVDRSDPSARDGRVRRAAEWYEANGFVALAATALGEAGDWEGGGEIALRHFHILESENRIVELADLFCALPPRLIHQHDRWLAFVAFMLYLRGDVATLFDVLSVAERNATPTQLVVHEYLRANAAVHVEDPAPCIDAAERCLVLCGQVGEDATYTDIYSTSRTEHWRSHSRTLALLAGMYSGSWARVDRYDEPFDPVAAVEMPAYAVGPIRGRRAAWAVVSGRLSVADEEVTTLLATALPNDLHADDERAQAYFALGELRRCRGDHDGALEALAGADRRARSHHLTNCVAAVGASRALTLVERGDLDGALSAIDEYRAWTTLRPPFTVAGLLATAEARVLSAQGLVVAALDVLRRAPRTAAVAFATVTVALDHADARAAAAAVDAWPDEPTPWSAVAYDLATAAVRERRADRRAALHHLGAALALAGPEGLVQPFLQVGVHLLGPLRRLAAANPFAAAVAERLGGSTVVGRATLSPREQLVLQQLATGASNREIAERLQVTLETIKSQTKAIYKKLDVANRAEAVAAWNVEYASE